MSTRSNIIIVTPDNQAHQFYHHCDGYLSGVGEELRGFLNESANYEDLLKKLAIPDEYGEVYEDEEKHDQSELDKLHGDIEFLYVIKNKRLYFMQIHKSKDYRKLRTYKELIDYICISKHEIDLTKEVTDDGYIYEDNKPEDYETTKTEVKTMNYAEEKTRIENEIKELTATLEKLKKQEEKEEKKNEWKKTLFGRFKEFIENIDFSEIDQIYIEARSDGYGKKFQNNFFSSFLENTAKVETEPTAEPEPEPIKEPAKPENKIVVASVPKLNETPEEKPIKMKMSLDELIKGME